MCMWVIPVSLVWVCICVECVYVYVGDTGIIGLGVCFLFCFLYCVMLCG